MTKENTVTVVCGYAPRPPRHRLWALTSSGMAVTGALVIANLIAFSTGMGFSRPNGYGRERLARALVGPNGPIAHALELHKHDKGRYPDQLRGLVIDPSNPIAATKWPDRYLNDLDSLIDPWGHEFRYVRITGAGPTGPGEEFKLWSIGLDGRDQTADDICRP